MPKQLPAWATKILAAVLLAATYVLHHSDSIPDSFHGVNVKGVCSTLIGIFLALGISGPTLWPQLAAFLGNPSGASVEAAKAKTGLPVKTGLPMVVALLALPFLGGAMCIKTPVGPTPPADGGSSFVNCSDAALHAAALNILPSVETAIASANYEQAIAALIAGIGGPLAFAEVACGILWIEAKAQANVAATSANGAKADDLEATKYAHAKAWLAAHPVQFAPVGP